MTTVISRQQLTRCALWVAAGFGVALGIVSALVGGMDAAFHIRDFDSGLSIGTLAYAIAGACGGVAIAFSIARYNKTGALALAGALGLGVGYFVTTVMHSVYIEPRVTGEVAFASASMVRFALIGAWTGLLLGAVQSNWKYIWLVIVAGAIGFGLASLAQTVANPALSRISETPNAIANAINFGIQGAIGGLIGGAFLGAAMWQSSRSGTYKDNTRA